MKRLILALTLIFNCVVALQAAPVPSDVQILEISHSTVYIDYASTEVYAYSRIRYGTTLSYEAGAGGGIAGQDTRGYYDTALARNRPRGNLFALAPSTLYYGCVQLSNDGSTWSACATFSFTTAAQPAIHPAPPAAATEVTAARPDWSTWTPVTATSCGDLQTKVTAAANAKASGTNTVIIVPYTFSCSMVSTSSDGDFKTITASAATNTITHDSPHGYSANQQLRFASYSYPGGIIPGVDYYVLSVDSTHYKLSKSPGGAELDITGDGAAKVITWPPPNSGKVAVVNSKVYDATFLPEGVQVSPDWFSVMPTFIAGGKGSGGSTPALDIDPTWHAAHDWYFVGIQFTYPDTATTDILTTTDPDGHWYTVNGVKRSTGNIQFLQCAFRGRPYPNRTDRLITELNGWNNAIADSWVEHADWWQGWATATVTKTDSTHISISTGTYWAGPMTFNFTSPVTITLTGGTNSCVWDSALDGCVIVYGAMNGHVVVLLPTGMSATCTGFANCDVQTAASPALPMTGDKASGVYLAVASLASGTIDQFAGMQMGNGSFNGQSEMWPNRLNKHATNEGCAAIVLGDGPGPTTIRNTHLEGTGILAHWDDGYSWGGYDYSYPIHGNFVARRNDFVSNPLYATGYPGSSGLRYGNRNQLEFKAGSKILVDANTFTGCFADIQRTGNVPFTTTFGAMIHDVTFSNNVHFDCGLGPGVPQLFAIYQPVGRIPKRALISNNLGFRVNAYKYYASNYLGIVAPGIPFFGGGGVEDLNISHNTVVDWTGFLPTTIRWFQGGGVEGFRFADNLLMASHTDAITVEASPYGHTVSPLCTGTSKQIADCNFRAGVGNPSYTITGNVWLPGYTDSAASTGAQSLSTFCTSLGGTWSSPNCTGGLGTGNKLVPGTTVADRIVNLGLIGVSQIIDLALKYTSGYRGKDVPTTDGKDPGVDSGVLKSALGLIGQPYALNVSTTTATIAVKVYDGATGVACVVGYGEQPAPPTAQTVAPAWTGRSSVNTTAATFRTFALSSLTPGKTYNGQVWCNGMKASATVQFRTQ